MTATGEALEDIAKSAARLANQRDKYRGALELLTHDPRGNEWVRAFARPASATCGQQDVTMAETRTACSCGDPDREGMTHMWLACWTHHAPRPPWKRPSDKATLAEEAR